jgi:predicted Kef-type K+ transport protein
MQYIAAYLRVPPLIGRLMCAPLLIGSFPDEFALKTPLASDTNDVCGIELHAFTRFEKLVEFTYVKGCERTCQFLA